MVKKNFLKSSLIIALAVVTALTVAVMLPNKVSAASNDSKAVNLTYSAHMQTYGDLKAVKAENEQAATPTTYVGITGESKRMESLAISFEGPEGVSLKYQAHVQGIGWQDAVTATKDNTTFIGTKGQSKRVEAIKLTVVGLDKLTAAGHSIKYRAHVQGEGWQDWVTADDKAYNAAGAKFAGTTGESKRIEAIEIAVVHEHVLEYHFSSEVNGVAKHTETCKLCNYTATVPCTYDGEWKDDTVSGKVYQACACGHKITKDLQEVLSDATALTVDKVDSALTVRSGKTLTVTGSLENTVTVNDGAKLILTSVSGLSVEHLAGEGTVIWAPEVEGETEEAIVADFATKFANASVLNLSSGKLGDDATTAKELTFELKLPELGTPQTIEDKESTALKLGKDWKVTIDLGKNILQNSATNKTGKLLENNGTLTLKNGTLVNNVAENTEGGAAYALRNEATGKLTLENVTINTTQRAIGTIGDLKVSNSTITGTDEAHSAIKIGDLKSEGAIVANEMKEKTISFDNVKIEGFDNGFVALSQNAKVNLNNVTVVARDLALHANNSTGSTNNSYIVTGGSYKTTGENSTVAYLASTGKSTFTNCTLEGGNGIETAGPELTLEKVTINANGPANQDGAGKVESGKTTCSGSAVILKLLNGYGNEEGMKLTVKNSTLTSAKGYVVNVAAGTQLNAAVESISVNYDSSSVLNGALGKVLIADSLKDKVTTTVQ